MISSVLIIASLLVGLAAGVYLAPTRTTTATYVSTQTSTVQTGPETVIQFGTTTETVTRTSTQTFLSISTTTDSYSTRVGNPTFYNASLVLVSKQLTNSYGETILLSPNESGYLTVWIVSSTMASVQVQVLWRSFGATFDSTTMIAAGSMRDFPYTYDPNGSLVNIGINTNLGYNIRFNASVEVTLHY